MARVHGRKQQQKLQKAKRKRDLARRKQQERKLPTSLPALIKRAAQAPFGPIWISEALFNEDAEMPALVTLIVTRRIAGQLLPQVVLVDRTCLGVKDAFVMRPCAELDLEPVIEGFAERGDPLQKQELIVAQSVIYHAIDYAASLGFSPQRDFRPELLGERPETLLDTPLCHPEQPFYVPGPSDDIEGIVTQLEERLGENFRLAGDTELNEWAQNFDFGQLEDEDQVDSWSDEIEAEGVSVEDADEENARPQPVAGE